MLIPMEEPCFTRNIHRCCASFRNESHLSPWYFNVSLLFLFSSILFFPPSFNDCYLLLPDFFAAVSLIISCPTHAAKNFSALVRQTGQNVRLKYGVCQIHLVLPVKSMSLPPSPRSLPSLSYPHLPAPPPPFFSLYRFSLDPQPPEQVCRLKTPPFFLNLNQQINLLCLPSSVLWLCGNRQNERKLESHSGCEFSMTFL